MQGLVLALLRIARPELLGQKGLSDIISRSIVFALIRSRAGHSPDPAILHKHYYSRGLLLLAQHKRMHLRFVHMYLNNLNNFLICPVLTLCQDTGLWSEFVGTQTECNQRQGNLLKVTSMKCCKRL